VAPGDTETYPTSGVVVTAAQDSLPQTVDIQVVLDPANLPDTARAGAFWEKAASVSLRDANNSGVAIQTPLTVTIPLRNAGDGNSQIRLFQFDSVAGGWVSTGQNAVVSDNGTRATFAAASFGTYGLFRAMPLDVTIVTSTRTGKAPLSVNLRADVRGGTPPYAITWDFGDNQGASGLSTSHLYEDPIMYQASVVVTDAVGGQVSNTVSIELH
ncbi:MAG TPA: PKD domain-containing protein, partial [bacterium]|nr:PKD domain-containing protein [bacterium]